MLICLVENSKRKEVLKGEVKGPVNRILLAGRAHPALGAQPPEPPPLKPGSPLPLQG